MQFLRALFELIRSLFPFLIRSFLSKYSIVKGVFYLLNNALISWVVSRFFDVNWFDVFLLFVVGFPLLSFLNRLKSFPPCLLAAYVMNKSLVRDAKKELKNLPLKTAEEWSDFQDFYEDDLAIQQHIASNPKAFVVYVRTRIQYQNLIT